MRIGLVDLLELAPTGIFSGSSASLQVELRVSPRCPCDGVSVARAAEVPQVGWRPGGRCRGFPLLYTTFGEYLQRDLISFGSAAKVASL